MAVPTTTAPAVAVRGLRKSFGAVPALRDVTFTIPWGCVLTVFGDNGAGKSTLLRTLATLTRPDEGTVHIAGLDQKRSANRIRQTVGYLGHLTLLYDELTAADNLRFYARLYGVSNAPERIDQVLADVGMSAFAKQRVRTMSNGMQKRIAIARALLHRPAVLLLDEPEAGLDPPSLALLDSVVRGVADSGAAVVLTTHNIERGLAHADHVLVLARGRVSLLAAAADSTSDDVLRAMRPIASRDGAT